MKILLAVISCVLSATPGWADDLFNFQGELDFRNNAFFLTVKPPQEGSVMVKAQKLSENSYNLSADVDHFKTPFFEVSSKIRSSWSHPSDNILISGYLQSQYSLVNFKPIRELSGEFAIKDNKIHLMNLAFGNFKCSGVIGLFYPYKLDLAIQMSSVNLKDFLNFWDKDMDYESAGDVAGEIKISGDLVKPFLRGNLETYNGFVDELQFDSLYLNIEGQYPHMTIAHSTVSQTNGMSYTFQGPINLKEHENFKKQLEGLEIAPLVSNTSSSTEWTIKRVQDESAGATEIKYILRKDQSNPGVKEDSDMLSVQRTMEF